MLSRAAGMSQAELWRGAVKPWAVRGVALLPLGAAVSVLGVHTSPWVPLALAPALGLLYLRVMRPLYAGLPLPARIRPLLVQLRLVPPV
jgi:hypothetical protein